jgi:hypothetical protein
MHPATLKIGEVCALGGGLEFDRDLRLCSLELLLRR